jgi:hypothetical protein
MEKTYIKKDSTGKITESANWQFPGSEPTDREVVRGYDGQLYFAGDEPEIPPPQPPSIEQQIIALETLVTPRRMREATLGIDNGWLADIDAKIANLRLQMSE